jgi:hypothetical protein
MTTRQRPRNAAGTYGFIDGLRHPSLLFKPPSPAQSQGDLEAVRSGGARKVSCFLRGSFAPYPHRLRQGTLYLSALSAHWEPFWSFNRIPRAITRQVLSVTTRAADYREPNVKKGNGGFLNVPYFTVVTCETPSGAFDLVVPAVDVPLVTGYFQADQSPGSRAHQRD